MIEKDTTYSLKEKSTKKVLYFKDLGTQTGASEFISVETLLRLKPHIKPRILIVSDFNSPLSKIDSSSRQKTKEIRELNNVTNQKVPIDVYKTFYQNTTGI